MRMNSTLNSLSPSKKPIQSQGVAKSNNHIDRDQKPTREVTAEFTTNTHKATQSYMPVKKKIGRKTSPCLLF